jgi:hypothetical protein
MTFYACNLKFLAVSVLKKLPEWSGLARGGVRNIAKWR